MTCSFPNRLDDSKFLVSALPWWMKARHRGQAVWQWCGLFLTLIFTAALLVFAFRAMGRLSHSHHGLGYYLAVVFPIFAIIIPQAATDFLSDQLFISGKLFANLDFALDLVSLAGLSLDSGSDESAGNGADDPSLFKPRQLNAHLAQLIDRAVGLNRCADRGLRRRTLSSDPTYQPWSPVSASVA